MKIISLITSLFSTCFLFMGVTLNAQQESVISSNSEIKYEVVSKLLNSNVRNGIGLKDLNGDDLPDLIIGSNAHRFDKATQTINADPNAGFRSDNPVPGHYQVSIHFNQTDNAAVAIGRNPEFQVPITSSELAVPPG